MNKSLMFYKIIDCLVVLFIILSSATVYDNIPNVKFLASEILIVLLFIKTIMLLKNNKNSLKISEKEKIFFISYFSIIIIYLMYFVINGSFENSWIAFTLKFLMVLPMFYLNFKLSKNNELINVLDKFENVILVISVISLFFYFFGTVLHIIRPTSEVLIDYGFSRKISSYFNIYFESQMAIINGSYAFRNCAIFVEGPMFAILLILSLANEYLFKKNDKTKKSYLRKIILIVTLLTTFSMNGLIFTIIIFLYSKFKNFKIVKNKNMLLMTGLIAIILLGFSLFILKDRFLSFSIRMDHYKAGLNAFFDSPIFGNGYLNTEAVAKYISSDDKGQSGSVTNILAEGGILISSIYILPFIFYILYFKPRNDMMKNIKFFFILYGLIFSTIFCTYTFYTLFILAGSWFFIIRRDKNENLCCYTQKSKNAY